MVLGYQLIYVNVGTSTFLRPNVLKYSTSYHVLLWLLYFPVSKAFFTKYNPASEWKTENATRKTHNIPQAVGNGPNRPEFNSVNYITITLAFVCIIHSCITTHMNLYKLLPQSINTKLLQSY
jgi:hypothetical protein